MKSIALLLVLLMPLSVLVAQSDDYCAKGDRALEMGLNDRAEYYYRQAFADDTTCALALGCLLEQREQYVEASAVLATCFSADCYAHRALCLAALQQWDSAASAAASATSAANKMTAYASASGLTVGFSTTIGTEKKSIKINSQTSKDYDVPKSGDITSLKTNLERLQQRCQERMDAEETDEDRKSRLTNNLVAAGVGGVATTLLANGIVSSAQKAKYESAANDAVSEWMNNIGSKIHCYVGGQLVGDFGDIVSVDISEE